MTVLTPSEGIWLIAGISAVFILLTGWVTRGRLQHRAEFLLANREMGVIRTATSIAASWIWAPSLFVAAQKAYEQGLWGILWFTIPNFSCLIIFGPLAARLRQRLPFGYTFPQYIRTQHGPAVHVLYLLQFFVLQICCFAVQVLAGATLISWLTGLSFSTVAIVLVVTPLIYAALGGMRASIVTDFLQIAVILGILAVIVPWCVHSAGGIDALAGGVRGYLGDNSPSLAWVSYSFGIPVTISLLSGPLGDQMQWQRGFVVRSQHQVIKAFWLGAVLFILVPISLSILGFLAANPNVSSGWEISNTQLVGPLAVSKLLPRAMSVVFAVMLVSSMYSTLDSVLCAVSALASTDVWRPTNPTANPDRGMFSASTGSNAGGTLDLSARASTLKAERASESADFRSVRIARLAMVATAVLGLAIAHIPGLKVLHLFLFYGTWRASTLIPTLLTLCWSDHKTTPASTDGNQRDTALGSRAAFAAILCSLILGAPVLAIGNYLGNAHLSVSGSLAVVGIGISVCIFGTRLERAVMRRRHSRGVP